MSIGGPELPRPVHLLATMINTTQTDASDPPGVAFCTHRPARVTTGGLSGAQSPLPRSSCVLAGEDGELRSLGWAQRAPSIDDGGHQSEYMAVEFGDGDV